MSEFKFESNNEVWGDPEGFPGEDTNFNYGPPISELIKEIKTLYKGDFFNEVEKEIPFLTHEDIRKITEIHRNVLFDLLSYIDEVSKSKFLTHGTNEYSILSKIRERLQEQIKDA